MGQQELVINAAWGLKLNSPSGKLGFGCATTEQEQQAAADVAHLDFVMEKADTQISVTILEQVREVTQISYVIRTLHIM